MEEKSEIGIIGTGVMGAALVKNFESKGFSISAYDKDIAKLEVLDSKTSGKVRIYKDLKAYIESLAKPRRIMLMLPAGKIIDSCIEELKIVLEKDDIIMDGGNSFFKDTIRRSKELTNLGFKFFGVGISGGEKGAEFGPCIMPGGNEESYRYIKTYLEKIAATKDGKPCCTYISENGAGHYVKMVHNGIEYSDMQLIAEVYLFMKKSMNKSNKEIAKIFEDWNKTEVKSYLIEITSKILKEQDNITGNDLIDYIKDESSSKGTGKWTSIESFELGIDVSMITSSLQARIISNNQQERKQLSRIFQRRCRKK